MNLLVPESDEEYSLGFVLNEDFLLDFKSNEEPSLGFELKR